MGEGSDFYLNKLKSVFDMFAVDLNFKMALIELLNNYPEELIIQELKENSVESLFQKAKSLSDERIKMNNEKYLYS
jgi:hypothetical protein